MRKSVLRQLAAVAAAGERCKSCFRFFQTCLASTLSASAHPNAERPGFPPNWKRIRKLGLPRRKRFTTSPTRFCDGSPNRSCVALIVARLGITNNFHRLVERSLPAGNFVLLTCIRRKQRTESPLTDPTLNCSCVCARQSR